MNLCEPGKDCNNCPLMNHTPETRRLALILNLAYEKFGDEFYKIVEFQCPNLTVCPECRIDDFVHVEGCTLDRLLGEAEDNER